MNNKLKKSTRSLADIINLDEWFSKGVCTTHPRETFKVTKVMGVERYQNGVCRGPEMPQTVPDVKNYPALL